MNELGKQYAGHTGSLNAAASGYAGDAAAKQTALGSLIDALKYAQSTAYEIHMTADRLCGTQPESVNSAKETVQPVSLFSQIEDVTRQLRDVAEMLSHDNQRIQARL